MKPRTHAYGRCPAMLPGEAQADQETATCPLCNGTKPTVHGGRGPQGEEIRELGQLSAEWAARTQKFAGEILREKGGARAREEDIYELRILANPAMMQAARTPYFKAMVSSDGAEVLSALLGASQAVQLVTGRAETLSPEGEEAQAALLEMQRSAAELVRCFEALAYRSTA